MIDRAELLRELRHVWHAPEHKERAIALLIASDLSEVERVLWYRRWAKTAGVPVTRTDEGRVWRADAADLTARLPWDTETPAP